MLLVSDGPATEVLRATAVGPFTIATVVVGTLAAAATLVVVALLLVPGSSHRVVRLVWESALALGALEVLWLVVDGGGLGDRRTVAALARVLLLVAGALVERHGTRVQLASLASLALLTVAVAMPAAGTPGALGLALAGSVLAVLLVVGVGRLLAGRWALGRVASLTLVAVLAVPGVMFGIPEPPPTHVERVVVDEVALDVTVAPLAPGPNEIHVYAWDAAGDEVALDSASAQVASTSAAAAGSELALFAVSENHQLSYDLELPPGSSWVVTVTAVTTDGSPRTATLELEAP